MTTVPSKLGFALLCAIAFMLLMLVVWVYKPAGGFHLF